MRAAMARAAAVLFAAVMPWSNPVAASDRYPDRPVKLVVGVPAGLGHDTSTRALAEGLQAELGQPFVVENKTGGNGVVAVRSVIAAANDGYTLLSAIGSQIVINPLVDANSEYDIQRDLVPVALVAHQPLVMVVHPDLPVRSVAELVAYSRANPGKLNYGSGTSTFMLATESFKQKTGADLLQVPYNGGGPAITALVAGTVHVALAPSVSVISPVKAGRLRPLAVASPSRLTQLPDVPTFAELGIADEVPVWSAIYAPAGTPRAIVDRLHAAIVKAVRAPGTRQRFLANDEVIVASTPEELAATVARDTARMRTLVKALGLPRN